jgi:hypothetical protein
MALLLGCSGNIFPLADQRSDEVLGKIEDAMRRQQPLAVDLADGSRLLINGSLLQYAVVVDAGSKEDKKPLPMAVPERTASPSSDSLFDSLVAPGMRT